MVVLSGALRERARVGAGPDHGVMVDVRLRSGAGCWHTGAAGAPGGVLRGIAGLPVGVVPALVRAAAVTASELVDQHYRVMSLPCSQR